MHKNVTSNRRSYINARDLRKEAQEKIADYDAILGRIQKDYDSLRELGIECKAFLESGDKDSESIAVSRMCWNHVFRHPVKRQSRIEKLERALCFPLALKLLQKTTTYQGVSREKDKGGNAYLSFEIIGYVRGNRIKVILRKQEKNTNPRKVLYSFFPMSSAPQAGRTDKVTSN